MSLRGSSSTALALVHRWLGVFGCLLFLNWFVSGIAMMYVRMPVVTSMDRLSHSRPLSTDSLHVTPEDALELIWFAGEPYWLAIGDAGRSVVVAARPPHKALERFGREQMEQAARAAASPGVAVASEWLQEYDEYYYDRDRLKPLPVLRARCADTDGTWMYLDPARGAIGLVVRDRDRLNRWLYHGLHSLDPAWLRSRRPLWDVLVVGLSLGGIVGVAASLVPAWRRIRRACCGHA